MSTKIRGLVVSVGGSQGAYAAGIIENKLRRGIRYNNLYGSSVGSLVVPFAASGNYKDMKEVFTNTTMDDIYSINPFKIKKHHNGMFRYSLSYYNIFKNLFIRKKSSLGDSGNLLTKLMPKYFPTEAEMTGRNVSVMVTNISTGELEIKKYDESAHEEFMRWVWASTCAPPFMSVAQINDCYYMDGGILSQVPIQQAIMDGCDEIDVIVLNKEDHDWPIEHIRNFLHAQIKVLLLMMNKIQKHQVDMNYLTILSNKVVKINFHYTKRRLTNNSLIFDPEMMRKWWDEGYQYSDNDEYVSYIIDGSKNVYYKFIDKEEN